MEMVMAKKVYRLLPARRQRSGFCRPEKVASSLPLNRGPNGQTLIRAAERVEKKGPTIPVCIDELVGGRRRLPAGETRPPALFSRETEFLHELLEARIGAQVVPVFVEQQIIQRVVKSFRFRFAGLKRLIQPAKNIISMAQVNMDHRFPIKFRVRFRFGSPQL